MVEQENHNLLVGGSKPSPATFLTGDGFRSQDSEVRIQEGEWGALRAVGVSKGVAGSVF